MLMRTQAGFLYESFSHDDGATWERATASRFNTSTGPPNILRFPAPRDLQSLAGSESTHGWLVVTWNNFEMPLRHQGEGVYGGRDALHIAISPDEGRTWRGFREIYLDHRRHDNPAKSGDRGTAYPLGAYTADGRIVVIAGQGAGGRRPLLIDPQWILETRARTDFSAGLEQWSVYKHHGPAVGWWRARAVGCELVEHPADPARRCLRIGKPDELPADGATWNFPNGWKGSLTTRVMLRRGSKGALLSLTDRMFDPTNALGEAFAVFQTSLTLDSDGAWTALKPDRWHDVTLEWDLERSECRLLVDGQQTAQMRLRQQTLNGISYVRFRSTATEVDSAGLLLDSVSVRIENPTAPPRTRAEQLAHEQRYVKDVVPRWTR